MMSEEFGKEWNGENEIYSNVMGVLFGIVGGI